MGCNAVAENIVIGDFPTDEERGRAIFQPVGFALGKYLLISIEGVRFSSDDSRNLQIRSSGKTRSLS